MYKPKLNPNLSVVIITNNRFVLAKKCLESIINQSVLPKEIIFIENSNSSYSFSFKSLKKLMPIEVAITYKRTCEKNASYLRNCGISKSRSEITLCIDDDVILDKNYIKILQNLHEKFPKVVTFVGKILPTTETLFSTYSSQYFMQVVQNTNMAQELRLYPSSTFSIRKSLHNQQIKFNERMWYCEDVDFFLKITYAGEKIMYHPSLLSLHQFRDNVFKFFLTFYRYANYYLILEKKFPKEFAYHDFFPNRKAHFLFLPLFTSYKIIKSSHAFSKAKNLPASFIIPGIICQTATFLGIYFSREGQEKLKQNFSNTLHLT